MINEKTLKVLEFNKIIGRLCELASSELGRELAEAVVPATAFREVENLLRETSDAASFVIRRGSPPMGGMHDIRSSLRRVELDAVLSPGELLRVADTLRAARNLKNYSRDIRPNPSRADDSQSPYPAEEGNAVASLIDSLETNKRLEDKISLAIVSEEEISDSASTTLSNLRRQIKEQQNSIKDKLGDMIRSSKYQKFMQESIVTLRGDRYVVPVKQEYRSEVPGLVHDSSASGATIFIEPMAVVEANNSIKQLKIKEQLEIERILQELTADVFAFIGQLKANINLLAKLDFIFAKAKLSLDYNCVCPRLNNEKRVVIKKGRHPLLDKKKVVPIDFWIGDEFNSLVITGPNTGGKTVTLKTIGLFSLMTQAGLHIPAAEGSEMCIFDKVFADIGDEQSIEQSLSTFSSHMTNIVRILAEADERSLVLFDELGAGTDPTEGAALAMAILEKLYREGSTTVATTHYSELKVFALTTDGIENACSEFDVETLKPTYHLLIGVPGKSNAFAISGRLGLTRDILDRAREFLSSEQIEFEDVLLTIEKNRSETEQNRMLAESYKLQIEKLKNELEGQQQRINAQKEKMLREAREEARKILLSARQDVEGLLQDMRKAAEEREAADGRRASEEVRLRLKGKLDDIEGSLSEGAIPRQGFMKPPENLKPGDSVLIVNLNRNGTVVTPPDKDGEAVIQAGIMKINVHVTNLKLADNKANEAHKWGSGRIGVSKAMNISTRADIRGMNVAEAEEVLDKFLDDAAIAGLEEITVIHGKGTGLLRNGIHKYLRSNAHVKEFRLGKYGEGEAGVTVVTLK